MVFDLHQEISSLLVLFVLFLLIPCRSRKNVHWILVYMNFASEKRKEDFKVCPA